MVDARFLQIPTIYLWKYGNPFLCANRRYVPLTNLKDTLVFFEGPLHNTFKTLWSMLRTFNNTRPFKYQ